MKFLEFPLWIVVVGGIVLVVALALDNIILALGVLSAVLWLFDVISKQIDKR